MLWIDQYRAAPHLCGWDGGSASTQGSDSWDGGTAATTGSDTIDFNEAC